jgi:hypothetical protein
MGTYLRGLRKLYGSGSITLLIRTVFSMSRIPRALGDAIPDQFNAEAVPLQPSDHAQRQGDPSLLFR